MHVWAGTDRELAPDKKRESEVAPGDGGSELRTRADRLDLPVTVEFSGQGVEGTGVVRDFSTSGARIENPSCAVMDGTKLRLRLSLFADARPLDFEGEVARQTIDGFAVRLLDVGEYVQQWLELVLPKAAEDAQAK